MRSRGMLVVGLISVIGAVGFMWPLLVKADSTLAHNDDSPLLFAIMLPLLLAVVLAELSDGVMDAKRVAMLGVLAALGAVLRPLGAGTGGIELVFLPIILGRPCVWAFFRVRAWFGDSVLLGAGDGGSRVRGSRSRCLPLPGWGWVPVCCRSVSPGARRLRSSPPTVPYPRWSSGW